MAIKPKAIGSPLGVIYQRPHRCGGLRREPRMSDVLALQKLIEYLEARIAQLEERLPRK